MHPNAPIQLAERAVSPTSCLPGEPLSICSKLGLTLSSESSSQGTRSAKPSDRDTNTQHGTTVSSKTNGSAKQANPGSDSLGIGVKAGIAVSLIVVAAISILIMLLFCRKRRAKGRQLPETPNGTGTGKHDPVREMPTKTDIFLSGTSELSDSTSRAELEGSHGITFCAELSGTTPIAELGDNYQAELGREVEQTSTAVNTKSMVEPATYGKEIKQGVIQTIKEIGSEDAAPNEHDEISPDELPAELRNPPPIPYASKPMLS